MHKDDEGPIQPGKLIARLVPDPEHPDVQRLSGFRLGESDRSGYWRLYLDADLSDYLEFKKENVLDGEEGRDGTTTIWLKPGTPVTRTHTQQAALKFLGGNIQSGFLRSTGFALARAVGTGGTLLPDTCCFTIGRGGNSPTTPA